MNEVQRIKRRIAKCDRRIAVFATAGEDHRKFDPSATEENIQNTVQEAQRRSAAELRTKERLEARLRELV